MRINQIFQFIFIFIVNNMVMGKYIDKALLVLTVTIITFALCYVSFQNLALSIAIALTVAIAFSILLKHLKFKNSKRVKLADFIMTSLIQEQSEFENLFEKAYSDNSNIHRSDRLYFDNSPIFFHLKFSQLSPDNLINYYRQAKELNAKEIYIVYVQKDKRLPYICSTLKDIKIKFIPIKTIYKRVKRKKLLTENLNVNKKNKAFVVSVLNAVFERKMIKRYVLLALIMLALSFITPLKTYYYVMVGILLSMATIAIIIAIKEPKESKPFK